MDATCTIQDSIHVFNLVHKYVSRILGTYQESTKNDGEIIEICKKSPMTDKYVRNDLGEYLNYPKIPNIGNCENPVAR